MSVNIQLEWTPNPSTLKYVVDRRLLPRGAMNFTEKAAAESVSPLATKLMGIPGVTSVMLGVSFVTVTKGEAGEWDELNDAVMSTLDSHLSAGEVIVHPEALQTPATPGGDSGVEARIHEVLDAEIRPALMADGGDVHLQRFEDGIAYLQLRGACSGCPSSTMTLKMGIETKLRDAIPELVEVVSV